MDSIGPVLSSGLTLTLSPAQALVGVGLLGFGRLFLQIARHLIFGRARLTVKSPTHGAEALFAPVITSSYTPFLDIDYNMHKSNSTFFNDLDDNRTELMLALFKDVPKMFSMGGTSCTFQKAIPPLARYEVSSRILCWDQKWIYVVSHFAKPGSNKPTRFLVESQAIKNTAQDVKMGADQQGCIYASAITKYVFKLGRITCSPEVVMEECGLLPPRPTTDEQAERRNIGIKPNNHWAWEDVQMECNKYIEVAQNFGSLDQLHHTFIGRTGPAMYIY
ncbi:hypothetical protein P154DRAFT_555082 [Amniculicola lignicola CBS 123094]|uniref:Thioesterase/thiol ester dehydrase-isomerase n=1 Tax=Amniculicola lignicola CBS 123094 TaxID=1392246 RepID=A0A6A5WFH9_9PLEO|nr:hypothetical protein P154DRAFT_555082 [Amniculicola lignicola CBS 123094]